MLLSCIDPEDDPALVQLVEEAHILRDFLMELARSGMDVARLLIQRATHEGFDAFRSRNRAADGFAGRTKQAPDYSMSYARLTFAIRQNIVTWERIVPISMRSTKRSPAPANPAPASQ